MAEIIVGALEANSESPSIQAVLKCARILEGAGFERPLWAELAEGRPFAPGGDEEDPCQPRVGWQKKAGTALDQHHHDNVVWPRLREHEQAMLQSQRGPLASTAFTSFPSDRSARFDSAPFRVLLLRRLRFDPSPCLFAVVGVAVHLTPLATIVQLAQQQGCWDAEVAR